METINAIIEVTIGVKNINLGCLSANWFIGIIILSYIKSILITTFLKNIYVYA